jgi:acyl carrier protein
MTTTTKPVTSEEIMQTIYRLLGRIAPEADLDQLSPDEDVRTALDIDSFDLLTLLIELNKAFGIEIPERDYGQLNTVRKTTDYLAARVG